MNTQQMMYDVLSIYRDPMTNRPIVESWSQQPTALEVLYLGDMIESQGVQSDDMVFKILETMLMMSLLAENITFNQLIEKADWRRQNDQQESIKEPVDTNTETNEELNQVESNENNKITNS